MPIELPCSGCGQSLRVRDEDAGMQARCPQCGAITNVPVGAPPRAAGPSPRAMPSGQATPDATASGPPNPYVSPPPLGPQVRVGPSTPSNGLAVASMVTGIVGLVFTLCCGLFLVLDMVAIVLGIIALYQIKQGQASGKGMAIAGIACGGVGVGMMILMLVIGIGLNVFSAAIQR